MTKEDKLYPLEIKDIKQIPKEKVIAAKIGAESDNYLMYAIKRKRLDILKFLLRDVHEMDFAYKNSMGMSVMHLAIRANSPAMVKLLCLQNHKNTETIDKVVQNAKIDDIKGNLNIKMLVKLLTLTNNKGFTPLATAVDHGNYEIFRFIFELYIHIQRTQARHPILSQIFSSKDAKLQETVLIKAIRLLRVEMAYSMLHLVGPGDLSS